MSATTASTNGTGPGPATSNRTNSSSSNPKQQLKSGKTLDGARKQAASPIDASTGKKPAPKAWQGTNPITQRASGANTPNGVPNGSTKPASAASRNSQQSSSQNTTVDKHSHDRMLYLLANFRGLDGRVTLRNGEKFEGIFAGASLESSEARFSMKMVKRTAAATQPQTNGTAEKLDEYIGSGDDHLVAFNLQDLVDLNVSDVQLSTSASKTQNGTAASFRTDAEISGAYSGQERELQRWQPGDDTGHDYSLDASGIGGWDQFATNEKLYNVKSDYDESIYTTSIDRSNPRFKDIEAQAARIAREIERSEPVNQHVAEERRKNANPDDGLDEEDKYSGVRRDLTPLNQGRPNAYVPPSRRPITSQPTVSGAPFDPAIISAQIARPSPTTTNNSDSQAALSKQSAQKNLATVEASKPATPAQPSTEANLPVPAPTVSVSTTTAQPTDTPKPASTSTQRKPAEGATEDISRKVLDSFKQFSNTEKLKHQERQRATLERNRGNARLEKSVKLNDLKKFAENFKLHTSVPADLVPILAKTKEKQEEIVAKAEQHVRDSEVKAKTTPIASAATPSKTEGNPPGSQSARIPPVSERPDTGNGPASPFDSRQRAAPPNFRGPSQAISSPRGPGMANHRTGGNQVQQRGPVPNANAPGPVHMADLRIPPTGPSQMHETGPLSPTSAATRLNVKAMEFRPNPSASTFTPGPGKTSPQEVKRASISTASASPPRFFSKDLKPPSERTPLSAAFNPIKRMADKSKDEKKADFEAANGGIPQAYRTGPTWDCSEANKDKSYADDFPKTLPATMSPLHTPNNGVMPHQHQLPPHLQNVPPPMPSAQQTPRQYQAHPHFIPNQHPEDHRMQYASSNSSVQPSPRMGHPSMAYNPQLHPPMQNYPGAMPPYGMSPGMQMRPMPAGQGFGPQGPQMGGHMMVQQPSNGPYMNGLPQMQMYPSPVPGHVQPHFNGHAQQQGMGGPFPNARGHPMSQQGSQQGHPQGHMYPVPNGPPMMMQQHPGQMAQMRNFPQSQYQGGPHPGYPMQHRAMSNNNGYNNHQMTPRQHNAAPHTGPGPGNAHGPGDEGK